MPLRALGGRTSHRMPPLDEGTCPMNRYLLLLAVIILLPSPILWGQTGSEASLGLTLGDPELVIRGQGGCGCCGCDSCGCVPCGHRCQDGIWTQPRLFGDLLGAESSLAQRGIVADLMLTQFYQGVASGGNEQTFEYGGKMDYIFTFQGDKLGLWQGLFVNLHAETRLGDAILLQAAGLAPANNNMLYPSVDNTTAITGLLVNQALSEEWLVTAGKYNTLDLLTQLYPQIGRGLTGFMNFSTLIPLSLARTFPLSALGAGVTKLDQGRVQGALSVFDTYNSPTTSGFDNLFENGMVLIGYWRIFTNFAGLPGSHAVLGSYSSGTYTSLDPLNWAFLPDAGQIIAGEQTGAWNLTYFYEKKLWVDACSPQRNLGLLTSWGIADNDPSPCEWAGYVTLQGQGLSATRPADSCGVGYFYSGLSGNLQALFEPVLPLRDLQGVELYYNAALTPWFHLTGDLQFVEPASRANDTAIVCGLRGKLDF